jgi:hypothetical protein
LDAKFWCHVADSLWCGFSDLGFCTPFKSCSHLLAYHSPQVLFKFWRFALGVLAQRFLYQRWIALCPTRPVDLAQEVIHQVFIQTNGSPRLRHGPVRRGWSGRP